MMTPAQVYSLAFGATLLVAGILGFFVNSSFDIGTGIDGDKLLLFEVNGVHNLVHIASGLVGLAVFRSAGPARLYAIGFGSVYLLVTVLGFIDGDNVVDFIPINAADNFLHLAISLAGIVAGLTSARQGRQPLAHTARA